MHAKSVGCNEAFSAVRPVTTDISSNSWVRAPLNGRTSSKLLSRAARQAVLVVTALGLVFAVASLVSNGEGPKLQYAARSTKANWFGLSQVRGFKTKIDHGDHGRTLEDCILIKANN